MKKSLKIVLQILLFIVFLCPLYIYAARIQSFNGTVTSVASNGTLTIQVDRGANYPEEQRISTYTVKPTSGSYTKDDAVSFSVNEDLTPPQVVADSVEHGTNPEANVGVGSVNNKATYRLFPDLSCPEETALTCYTNRVFSFTQVAVLLLAVAAFVVAGIIYMTSGGNPKRVESAKKIMIGALSAVAVVILGKFFLTNVIGLPL